jgi:hypothetical protein
VFRASHRTFALGVFLLPIAVAGCSGSRKLPQTFPATGQVLMGGQPVAGAEVHFTPVGGEGMKSAHATTDSAGRFHMLTYFGPGSDVDGALANEYAVAVRKIPPATGIVNLEAGQRPPANELPEKYANARTSSLTAVVRPEGKNEFVFELTP